MRIGKSLQDAWDLFLKAPEVFICLALAYCLLNVVLVRIPGAGAFGGILVPALFVPAFLVAADEVQRTGKARMETMKASLNVFPQMVVLLLLKFLIIGLGLFFLLLPGLYFGVVYIFAECFCVLEKKTFWEAMEASRALVKGRWWACCGLSIVSFLLIFCGLMFLLVGVLVTAPLTFLLLFCVFQNLRRSGAGLNPDGIIDAEIVP